MPERLTVTPLQARIVLINEIFSYPHSDTSIGFGHYSQIVAKALHGSHWREWYHPESRTLKPEDIYDAQRSQLLLDRVDQILDDTLYDNERKILKIRFGFDDGRLHTLAEVGEQFKRGRERMRQVESKALRKLRHPSRSKLLREFLTWIQ